MGGKYIVNQTAGSRVIILEENDEGIQGGYFDTEGAWHELEGPLDGDLDGRYVINETAEKRVVLLEEDAEKIGGGYFDTEGTWVPFAVPVEFKNPIYDGTAADANAIEAVFNKGYHSADATNTSRNGMTSTCFNKKAQCWSTGKPFNALNTTKIKAVFSRTEGNASGGHCTLVVAEKIEDMLIAMTEYNISQMGDAYGDYLYADVRLSAETPSATAEIDFSDWAHKNSFYVSVIYKTDVDGYYNRFKTDSITLSQEV